jgi:hypothetical protein
MEIFRFDCYVVLVLLVLKKEFVVCRLRVITNSNFHSFETTGLNYNYELEMPLKKLKKNYFQKLKFTRYCCVHSLSRIVS